MKKSFLLTVAFGLSFSPTVLAKSHDLTTASRAPASERKVGEMKVSNHEGRGLVCDLSRSKILPQDSREDVAPKVGSAVAAR